MAWGIDIWGEDSWAPEGNFSFELRGPPQGSAEDWSVYSVAGDERVGVFDETYVPADSFWGSSLWNHDWYSTGLVLGSWDSWEDFEEMWELPHHVHSEADTANVVTAPDATVGDWPSQRTLIGDLYEQYKYHLQLVGRVHLSQDVTNFIPLSQPDDLDQAIGFANLFRILLYGDMFPGLGVNPVGHFTMWGQLGVHGREDVANRPALGECTDEYSMVDLINHLKAKFNAHLGTTSTGSDNKDAKFEFQTGQATSIVKSGDFCTLHDAAGTFVEDMITRYVMVTDADTLGNNGSFFVSNVPATDELVYYNPSGADETGLFSWTFGLQPGMVRDLRYEAYERGWAIPDLLPYVWDLPPLPERQEIQRDMVRTDWGIAGGGGWGFDATREVDDVERSWPHRWGELVWGAEQFPSWKIGHEEFWKDLSDIVVQVAIPGGERFEHSWKLPGSSGTWYNERFIANFWDAAVGEYRFLPGRIQLGVTENFESGWKDNEVGLSKYWSGTEWRYLSDTEPPTRQIVTAGFDPYDFTDGATSNPALVLPSYSPSLWIKFEDDYDPPSGYAHFDCAFQDKDDVTHIVYFYIDGEVTEGTVVTKVSLVNSPTAPRYEFTSQFNGCLEVGEHSPSLVVFQGHTTDKETFESGWTLTLTI